MPVPLMVPELKETTMAMTMEALVAAVKAHANTYYNERGWDYVVEAFDDEYLAELIGGSKTARGAIRNVAKVARLHDDRRRDIQATAF